jgi:acyl-CoA reductase-like NAD-dependent aldehyde dehydrogenase
MKSGIPWGGAKESGVGRMKTKEGLREFTNIKVIA